jgi:hypothetical protein
MSDTADISIYTVYGSGVLPSLFHRLREELAGPSLDFDSLKTTWGGVLRIFVTEELVIVFMQQQMGC